MGYGVFVVRGEEVGEVAVGGGHFCDGGGVMRGKDWREGEFELGSARGGGRGAEGERERDPQMMG